MKILHALRGLEATSGISTFVVELCNRQAEAGHQVCFVYQRSLEHSFSPKVLVLQESDIERLGWRPDIVHVHAIWSPFSVRILRWCVKISIPFVVSPHGCLMPRVLQNGKIKKWIFLNLLLRPLLKKAKVWHCTGDGEVEACRSLGFIGPFEIVPIGCDVPKLGGERKNTVLFLGRISEEKGLRLLLDAWGVLKPENWTLVIAGPDWFGERKRLEDKIVTESIPNIRFVGVADAALKDCLYREAKVFVLPSPMENFSAVVLDALAYSVPVITTKGTPWRVISERNCGWWIEQGVRPLVEALGAALNMSDAERESMGAKGRMLVEERYVWDGVVNEMLAIYEMAQTARVTKKKRNFNVEPEGVNQ